jgi:hypothetical protein
MATECDSQRASGRGSGGGEALGFRPGRGRGDLNGEGEGRGRARGVNPARGRASQTAGTEATPAARPAKGGARTREDNGGGS